MASPRPHTERAVGLRVSEASRLIRIHEVAVQSVACIVRLAFNLIISEGNFVSKGRIVGKDLINCSLHSPLVESWEHIPVYLVSLIKFASHSLVLSDWARPITSSVHRWGIIRFGGFSVIPAIVVKVLIVTAEIELNTVFVDCLLILDILGVRV